jgi:hypothetical protein
MTWSWGSCAMRSRSARTVVAEDHAKIVVLSTFDLVVHAAHQRASDQFGELRSAIHLAHYDKPAFRVSGRILTPLQDCGL